MRISLEDGRKVELIIRKNEKNVYEFYMQNKKIGVFNPKVMMDNILILENTIENELASQIKEVINQIDTKEIEKESKETKQIDTYMREIGQRNEKIKDIRVIELKKETEKPKKKEQENLKKQEEKNHTTIKDVNIKQEISLAERANDMHDMRKWLGGKVPQEIKKIGIIESNQMDNIKNEKGESYKENTTRYSLVTIDKDGNVEPLSKYIPELKQRDAAGNNPIASKMQVRDDGSVEQDAILSEYEIGDKIIQLDNKEMGRVEMNIGEEEHGGTETMGVQVRDSNTPEVPSTSVRSTMGEYEQNGEYTVDENLKEAKKHLNENPNCNKMNEKDIDGDSNTKSHDHIDDMVKEVLKNDEISDVYNSNDVRKHIEAKMKNNEKLDEKEIMKQVEEEMSASASEEHEMPSPDRRN